MPPKLRVLHVIGGLQTGGAEALLFRLVTRKSEVEHHVVALAGPDWHTSLLEARGIPVHHLNIRSVRSVIGGVTKLSRLIKSVRPDVIQSWMYGANLIAGILGRRHGVPVVWGVHASTSEGLGRASRAAARLGGVLGPRLADHVINCSSRSAQNHLRLGFGKIAGSVINNGYDPTLFFPEPALRRQTRDALAVADDCFLIGTVARWNVRKDVPNLLKALGLVVRNDRPFKCLLIGRGLDGSNAALVSELRANGSEESVVLLGQRSDLPELARALDLHVLPSATEAFPSVVAETMLSETPNVVTDVGDAALMVGDCGWVVPPRDAQTLADAIEAAQREWKDRPSTWQQRRARSRERMVERFTLDRMARGYEDVWRMVVGDRASRR